ncbi:hypothetical protein JG687_00005390 [Phytophthora cactorum]|uniref:Uncharacterized protein n=1 Tax=Phytophthora cactorum TaxID=29920 RepID=A0A8T1UL09_9STRA|nr:hypothetical protein JG687_00005390 [Phytophthora cactorum]
MEIMDRSENNGNNSAARFNDSESSFARGKRKEQFLKKAEGDPISLLNALRTHLRLRFAQQEAQQAATSRRILAEDLNNQQKEQNARDELQQLEITCKELKEQQNSLIHQLNQHEVDQTRMRRQHQILLEKLNAQVQEERSRKQAAKLLVAKQQQEIVTLKEAREALINQKTLEGILQVDPYVSNDPLFLHERVAKALEQVNGLRYRYHPAPQDGKKMLRFDSDDEEASSDGEDAEVSSDEAQGRQRRQSSKEKAKRQDGDSNAPWSTLDDHIENLLRKTRTLAMLKIANNTAGTIPSDSEGDSDEADDIVSEELKIGSLSSMGSSKRAASFKKLSSLGSSSSMNGQQSSLLGTAAMRLARTLSAFLCLPRAISYVDLEAVSTPTP